MVLITVDMKRRGENFKMTISNEQSDRREKFNTTKVNFEPKTMVWELAVLTTKRWGYCNNRVTTMMDEMIGGSMNEDDKKVTTRLNFTNLLFWIFQQYIIVRFVFME